MDASDRTRQYRSLVQFQAKLNGTNKNGYSRTSEVMMGVDYGAIVSTVNDCCDRNYSAYFTVTEEGRGIGNRPGPTPLVPGVPAAPASTSKFNIPAGSAFTIEWWQTEVTANAPSNKPRLIFSFGTCCSDVEGNPEFSCTFEDRAFDIRIAGSEYPPGGTIIPYGDDNDFDSLLTPNHFAIVRDLPPNNPLDPHNIRVYRNGGFLGEFTYGGEIQITNQGDKLFTLRNQTIAEERTEMYGSIHSFRWTAEALYYTDIYYINHPPDPANPTPPPYFEAFDLPPLHMPPNPTNNVLTITRFPNAGSITVDGCTVTRFDAADL